MPEVQSRLQGLLHPVPTQKESQAPYSASQTLEAFVQDLQKRLQVLVEAVREYEAARVSRTSQAPYSPLRSKDMAAARAAQDAQAAASELQLKDRFY